ncbi:hypothetical protein N656DRAFT_33819 [Canariomyces notabilis]|uniref:Uncharacterized protein n=1 Tax=Canariomyces notabilis TaxID=2074819 RepID=A0AAN6TNQ5_9PEZI|nr:hypothetical protein N656DRAFT_33819 [Canariomyces arenarius]
MAHCANGRAPFQLVPRSSAAVCSAGSHQRSRPFPHISPQEEAHTNRHRSGNQQNFRSPGSKPQNRNPPPPSLALRPAWVGRIHAARLGALHAGFGPDSRVQRVPDSCHNTLLARLRCFHSFRCSPSQLTSQENTPRTPLPPIGVAAVIVVRLLRGAPQQGQEVVIMLWAACRMSSKSADPFHCPFSSASRTLSAFTSPRIRSCWR